MFDSDILIPVKDSVGLFSFIQTESSEFKDFNDSLNRVDGYAVFETVDQLRRLESFIMELVQ